jgi:DNA-binding transcriptional ArsR family regulator
MIDYSDAKKVAGMLAAVGEPTRLMILCHLAQGPHHVGALAESIGIPMVNMSHHLGVMRQAGLLDDEKDGRRVIYRIHPDISLSTGEGEVAARLAMGRYRLVLKKESQPAVGPRTRAKNGKPARKLVGARAGR